MDVGRSGFHGQKKKNSSLVTAVKWTLFDVGGGVPRGRFHGGRGGEWVGQYLTILTVQIVALGE